MSEQAIKRNVKEKFLHNYVRQERKESVHPIELTSRTPTVRTIEPKI